MQALKPDGRPIVVGRRGAMKPRILPWSWPWPWVLVGKEILFETQLLLRLYRGTNACIALELTSSENEMR